MPDKTWPCCKHCTDIRCACDRCAAGVHTEPCPTCHEEGGE